jgi:hypothetical protein
MTLGPLQVLVVAFGTGAHPLRAAIERNDGGIVVDAWLTPPES